MSPMEITPRDLVLKNLLRDASPRSLPAIPPRVHAVNDTSPRSPTNARLRAGPSALDRRLAAARVGSLLGGGLGLGAKARSLTMGLFKGDTAKEKVLAVLTKKAQKEEAAMKALKQQEKKTKKAFPHQP